jgi:hypothetical protein
MNEHLAWFPEIFNKKANPRKELKKSGTGSASDSSDKEEPLGGGVPE